MSHGNARTDVHGRLLIVQRHQAGWPQAHIAQGDGCLTQVREHLDRPLRRRRRSRPARPVLASALDADQDQPRGRAAGPRAATRRAPRARTGSAAELGLSPRTVSRILRRHQVPYLRECDPITGEVIRASKVTAVRYERDTSRRAGPRRRQEARPDPRRRWLGGPRPRATRRPPAQQKEPDRLRLRPLDGRRPLPAGLLRDPARREGRHLRGVPRSVPRPTSPPTASPASSRSSPTTTSATNGPTTSATRSPPWAPSTCSSSRTAPGRTARSNASTGPWPSSGPTGRSSPATPNEQPPLRHGSSTTTLRRRHSALGGLPPVSRLTNLASGLFYFSALIYFHR